MSRKYTIVTSLLPALTLFLVIAMPAHDSAIASTQYVCPNIQGSSGSVVSGTRCYVYFATETTWSQAQQSCGIRGGKLATIRSSSQNTAVASILSSTEPWIGASDSSSRIAGASEGEFFWVQDSQSFWTGGQGGSAVGGAYTNWNVGTNEPNNAFGVEHCVHMYVNGQWNDLDCDDTQPYICEVGVEEAVATSAETTTSGGGVRSGTLERRMQEAQNHWNNRQQSDHVAGAQKNVLKVAESVEEEPQLPVVHAAAPANQQRICDRVLKNFRTKPKMLAKVNVRLQKSMGFTCGQ